MRGRGYSTAKWIRKELMKKPNNPYTLWDKFKAIYGEKKEDDDTPKKRGRKSKEDIIREYKKERKKKKYHIGSFYTFYHMFWLLKKLNLIKVIKVIKPSQRRGETKKIYDSTGKVIDETEKVHGKHLPIKIYAVVKKNINNEAWNNPTKAYIEKSKKRKSKK